SAAPTTRPPPSRPWDGHWSSSRSTWDNFSSAVRLARTGPRFGAERRAVEGPCLNNEGPAPRGKPLDFASAPLGATVPMSKQPAKKVFTPNARGPLNGIRIVDLSRLVAGNVLTLQLADFGAEVIKIEPPEGDTLRSWRVKGVETAWKVYSRNKKSVALDLRSDAGRAIVRRLAASAAILVESFRPGVLEDMGLAPAELHELNPKLVIVRISGWGQEGRYR